MPAFMRTMMMGTDEWRGKLTDALRSLDEVWGRGSLPLSRSVLAPSSSPSTLPQQLGKPGSGPYIFGSEPSHVDIMLFPFLARMHMLERYQNYTVDAKAMPKVSEYIAFSRTSPIHKDHVYTDEQLTTFYDRKRAERAAAAAATK